MSASPDSSTQAVGVEHDETKMGLIQCTSLVIGNMVGSGVFLLPASLALFGSVCLLGWAITAVGGIALALVYARFAGRYTDTGGPYTYTKAIFGRFAAFQVGWTYWMANGITGNVALCVSIVSNLTGAYPEIAESVPLQLAIGLGSLWILTFLNAIGVVVGGRVQVVLTFAKLIPLIGISIWGLFFVDWSMIYPFTSGKFTMIEALSGSVALTLFAFIGLESSTVPAEAVENPRRNIPLSTVVGTALTAVLYMLTTLVVMGLIQPHELASCNSPIGEAGCRLFGPSAGIFFSVLAAISSLGTLNGMILLQGQMPYAGARDGLFPRVFEYLSRRKVPLFGLFLSTMIVSLFLILGQGQDLVEQFTFLGGITIFCVLVPYLLTALADLVQLWQEREIVERRQWIRAVGVAGIATLYSVWAFIGIGVEALLYGVAFVVLITPVYLYLDSK